MHSVQEEGAYTSWINTRHMGPLSMQEEEAYKLDRYQT